MFPYLMSSRMAFSDCSTSSALAGCSGPLYPPNRSWIHPACWQAHCQCCGSSQQRWARCHLHAKQTLVIHTQPSLANSRPWEPALHQAFPGGLRQQPHFQG